MGRSPNRRRLRRLASLLFVPLLVPALLSPLASCADDAEFQARFTPDYPQTAHATVSVFGVFKDGRMSAETWDAISPLLSGVGAIDAGPRVDEPDAAPVSSECPAAFDTALVAKDMNLFTAVDSYTRANGVTDGLLEKVAPNAKGDLLMVVTISGHVPITAKDGGGPGEGPMQAQQPPMGGSGRGGGMSGRRGMATTSMRHVEERQALEIAASFYSKSLKRAVGVVSMSYTGKSADEALRKFAAKIRGVLGGAPCAGWTELHLDQEAIQHIEE